MAIPSKQIGWSDEANLLWYIAKELEQIKGQLNRLPASPTTTTTTTTAAPSTAWTAYPGYTSRTEACSQSVNSITLYTAESTISPGILIYANSQLTVPAYTAYSSFNFYKISGDSVSYEVMPTGGGNTALINPVSCV